MHGLEQQYGQSVNFIYLDIDDPRNETDFKRQLGYLVLSPNIFLLDGMAKNSGVLVWLSQKELEAALQSAGA